MGQIPTDLAVEVVSPDDMAEELEERFNDYRMEGVPLLWVIDPGARTARVHRRDGSASYLTEDDDSPARASSPASDAH